MLHSLETKGLGSCKSNISPLINYTFRSKHLRIEHRTLITHDHFSGSQYSTWPAASFYLLVSSARPCFALTATLALAS
jgi:hypothetical protein